MANTINARDKALIPPDSDHRVEEHEVSVNGGEITVRCMIPTPGRGRSNSLPLLVHYHGGGWMPGDFELDDIWLKQVCVKQQISIVNVEYRLAPEYPYPTQQEYSYVAPKWKRLHRFRNLRWRQHLAGLVLRASDDPFFDGQPLTGQILQAPCIFNPDNIPDRYKAELRSMDMPLHPAFLNKYSVQWVLGLGKLDPDGDIAFPLLHPNHANLAPAVFQICDLDPLYAGVPHGFFVTHSQIEKSKQFVQNLKDGIAWLLEGAPNA
ncbi:hypothetical protein EWM64_g6041 [Hericium alpestre]|uniref:Alpha/beta hydrolase fold-3 domain-containing protein n=1 Tax=Hericium alpestre TaxID=135208 RepID=A0A4Y9ZT42_9AGAM|nr:hypothetical protein EWM64_g6041 [Hericium alpestre]